MNENLIKMYDKLIKKIAASFYNASFDDLYQAGCIGLLKAYKKYKKENNAKFSSYAYTWIYGEMYEFVNNSRSIKISSNNLKLYKKIIKAKELLSQKLGKIPTNNELSHFLNIEEEIINDAMLATEKVLSIEGNDEFKILDKIYNKDDNIENKILIDDSLQMLEDIEKDIIKCRYFEDKTQSETAKSLNITQVMVSRYEKKSLQKLKKYIHS